MNRDLLRYWPLDPTATYLNHGAYGACPWPVLHEQSEWRARMERQPTAFNDRELEGHLDRARAALAEFVGADPDDLAFVPNATTGVSTVLRSLEFAPGDEILTTDHEYNACRNAVRFAAAASGAREVVAHIPLPIHDPAAVTEAIVSRATARTRLAVISLVTSPTGLVFPIEDIVRGLAERGVDTLVDGAHAPGMLPLDLAALGAAYFTGNAHKWLCTPKGSALLHVRRDRQDALRPLVISHGTNSPRRDRSRFRLEFDWGGTGDPTPYLVIPTALEFMAGLLPGGWAEIQAHNRSLAISARRILLDALGAPGAPGALAPESMLGSLAAVELPPSTAPPPLEPGADVDDESTYPLDPLHDWLWDERRIEVPVYPWPHSPADSQPRRRLLRISAQVYNTIDDYELLASVLGEAVAAAPPS
jgi:isopenicillin-N epimerase